MGRGRLGRGGWRQRCEIREIPLFARTDVYNKRSHHALDHVLWSSVSGHLSRDVRATECGFWACIKRMSSRTVASMVTETVLNHWDKADAVPYTMTDDLIDVADTDYHFVDVPGIFTSVASASNTTHTINREVIQALANSINPLLMGQVALTMGYYMEDLGKDPDHHVTLPAQVFWLDGDDLDGRMAKTSAAMTNQMRLGNLGDLGNVGANEKLYGEQGTAWTPVVFIKVRWGWLTFPATLVLLSVAFLAVTIGQSAQGSAGLWKNSALAALCTSIGTNDQGHPWPGFANSARCADEGDHGSLSRE